MNYLRRTKIGMPECMKPDLLETDTLRIGVDAHLRLIELYLVPRKGSGQLCLVARLNTSSNSEHTCAFEAKTLAKNKDKLTEVLKQYVANNHQPVIGYTYNRLYDKPGS